VPGDTEEKGGNLRFPVILPVFLNVSIICYREFIPGGKAAGAWSWRLTCWPMSRLHGDV